MRITCCCCGKQILPPEKGQVSPFDPLVTTGIGTKAGFWKDEAFCGHCAADLDENGNFPEEAS